MLDEAFDKDDKIVLARVFTDRLETKIAASKLRTLNIPHYVADSNANLFTENVLGGERLFIRAQDMDIVAEALADIKPSNYANEESWYQETRTLQGYQPYQLMTYIFMATLFISALVLFIYFV